MKNVQTFAFAVMAFVVLVMLIQNDEMNKRIIHLTAENLKFRVIGSTIDKLTYRIPPNIGAEIPYLIRGATAFNVDPIYLTAVRRVENGRYLFEMGVQNISKRVKDSYPDDVDSWQFYESAYLISRQQTAFCMANMVEFTAFLGEIYPNSDPIRRQNWKTAVVKVYADLRKAQ
jgi:hypothetical protein